MKECKEERKKGKKERKTAKTVGAFTGNAQ
jgi:hypothetical protein